MASGKEKRNGPKNERKKVEKKQNVQGTRKSRWIILQTQRPKFYGDCKKKDI